MNEPRHLPALAALNGFLAISFGAFGAHAISSPQAQAWITTATQFQLAHAVAVFALLAWQPVRPPVRIAGWFLAIGSLLFATALQALALGAPKAVAMVAPVGGAAMLLGWLLVLLAALGRGRGQRRGI
ncbi:MAG: DUF423 domain-containing protein [Sandaracinobacteroides sp.]